MSNKTNLTVKEFDVLVESEKAEPIWAQAEKSIMALPGMILTHKPPGRHPSIEIDYDEDEEDYTKKMVYLKMMSSGGVTDDANGIALQTHLKQRGIAFISNRPRSLSMLIVDFLNEFVNQ